jgi:uncharacterized lipoprotein YajG
VIFSRRASLGLLTAAATLLIVGCAPATLETPIKPPPQTRAPREPAAASPRFLVLVSDSRNKADAEAHATAFQAFEIATNYALPRAVSGAIRIELQNRGFRIGPAAPELFFKIDRMDVERRVDNNSARAVFTMQVQVEKEDGKVIYTHEAEGEHDESKIEGYSEQTAERVSNLAIRDCVQRLFADPGFINALSEAHNS